MIFTLWKNKNKKEDKHPDFYINDEKFNRVGVAYKNKSKKGVDFIRASIEQK